VNGNIVSARTWQGRDRRGPKCHRNWCRTGGERRGDSASTHRSGEMRRSRNLPYALVSHSVGSPSRIMPPPAAAWRTTSTPVNSSTSLSVKEMEVPSVGWRRVMEGRARDRVPSDKSTDSGPYPNAAATPARVGLPLAAAAGSKSLSVRTWCPAQSISGSYRRRGTRGSARESPCCMFCRVSNVQRRAPSPGARRSRKLAAVPSA
jgi:hypothetical protein